MRLNLWLGLLVSAAAVAGLLYQIDFGEAAEAFRFAHYGWLLPAVLANLLTMGFRSWRWRYLLEPDVDAPFEARVSATFIGFMANGLLPARIGEFVRAWCLGNRLGKSKSGIFASIVVERLIDGLWVLVYLVVALWAVPFPGDAAPGGGTLAGLPLRNALQWAGFLSLALYGGIILFLLLLYVSREKALRWMERLLRPVSPRWAEKSRTVLAGFTQGIYLPRSPRDAGFVLLSTGLLWFTALGVNHFTALAFGQGLPWHAPVFLLVMQAIGVMIPSSPGFVGTYHAATSLGLRLYGVSSGVAVSFAVTVHLISFLPVVLVGLGFLWRENLTFRSLTAARNRSPAD